MTFFDWKQGRLQHVLAAKQQAFDTTTCDQCIQWAWPNLDECICGTVQVTGWCLVGVAIILFIPASFGIKTLYSQSPSINLGLTVISLLVSITGLIGALLSMQMLLVIAYDATTFVVNFVLVVGIGGQVMRNRIRKGVGSGSQYQQLSDESQTQAKSWRESLWKFLCYSALSLTLVSSMCALKVQGSHLIEAKKRDLQFPATRNFTTDNTTISLQEVLLVVGYVMGSLACFGQWAVQWNNIRLREESLKNVTTYGDSRVVMCSRVCMVASSTLYVTGILLQSGGWMVVMVTLPWTIKSFIGAHAECYELVISHRIRCHYRKVNNTDDSDVISLTESGSDTSNILWDRAWKDRSGGLDDFPYYEKVKPKLCFDLQAMRMLSNNISTNSDWSSSSDEQELEWEDAHIAPYNTPSKERKIRMERIVNSTPPRTIPLTLTMPESSDQRIITWISNSTPEEEKSPALTMALNLDTSPQTSNLSSIISDSRTLPYLSPRKYSL